jgi:hypothetical protein
MTRYFGKGLLLACGCIVAIVSGHWGLEADEPAPISKATPRERSARATAKITSEARTSIDAGMKWLLSAIRHDGALGMDLEQRPDLGCTAIAGMALIAEGNTPTGGEHMYELRRVMNAVLDILQRPAQIESPKVPQTLLQRKIGRNADLFLSALFLSQLAGESAATDQEIRKVLKEVVDVICEAQESNGTWGHESWAPVLGTVLGWESLRASSSAGLRIDASATLAGKALMKNLEAKSGGDDWMHDFYREASSIRVLYSLDYRDRPEFKRCVERMIKTARSDPRPFQYAGGEEFLSFYLVTECLLKEGDPSWQAWYPAVSGNLINIQNTDGSWTGHHCITARTFCTAAALLTLMGPNQYMPISDL